MAVGDEKMNLNGRRNRNYNKRASKSHLGDHKETEHNSSAADLICLSRVQSSCLFTNKKYILVKNGIHRRAPKTKPLLTKRTNRPVEHLNDLQDFWGNFLQIHETKVKLFRKIF